LVLTVPMRNGNKVLKMHNSLQKQFLPYLWGMETNSVWIPLVRWVRVLTVPMRNGNTFNPISRNNWVYVLTVPMRNGNNGMLKSTSKTFAGFLPYLWGMETPWIILEKNAADWGSYRTYEEWKLNPIWQVTNSSVCSYRTYEEWKQFKN